MPQHMAGLVRHLYDIGRVMHRHAGRDIVGCDQGVKFRLGAMQQGMRAGCGVQKLRKARNNGCRPFVTTHGINRKHIGRCRD